MVSKGDAGSLEYSSFGSIWALFLQQGSTPPYARNDQRDKDVLLDPPSTLCYSLNTHY